MLSFLKKPTKAPKESKAKTGAAANTESWGECAGGHSSWDGRRLCEDKKDPKNNGEGATDAGCGGGCGGGCGNGGCGATN